MELETSHTDAESDEEEVPSTEQQVQEALQNLPSAHMTSKCNQDHAIQLKM